MLKQSIVLMLIAACSSKPAGQEQPGLQGYCGYLTTAEVEAALGRSLTETPVEINEDYLGGKGCSYFAGKDGNGVAYFGYVVFPDESTFEKNKPGSEVVSGVGDEAFRFNGPDAQKLWVRKGDHYVMIAIGDVADPEGSKTLATLVLSRLCDEGKKYQPGVHVRAFTIRTTNIWVFNASSIPTPN